MIPTGIDIDLSGVLNSHRVYDCWPSKKAATAALKAFQQQGLNVTDTISAHPARSSMFRFWVIGRPDDLAEMTLLLREDGSWARGRLWSDYTTSRWEHLELVCGPIPATFTHITRTVLAADRGERYRSNSNGSCGRWVRNEDAVALCTCGWKSYAANRAEARSSAAAHRAAVAA